MPSPDATNPSFVRHVVHIRLEPGLDDDQRTSLERDLESLVAQHPHSLRASLQRDLGRKPEASVSATWMVTMDFTSMEDFEQYLTSAQHRDFLQTHQRSMAFITAIQVAIDGGT